MGLTAATFAISNQQKPRLHQKVHLMVDTGSTLTWISSGTLRGLGVRAGASRTFGTVDGRSIRRKTGYAIVEYDGTRTVDEVVFAQRGDAQVLGVRTLEGLGLRVNPIARKLERVGLLAV